MYILTVEFSFPKSYNIFLLNVYRIFSRGRDDAMKS